MNDRPPLARSSRMLLTTLESVPGHKTVKHLGLVQGSTVRAKNVGRDIAS